MSSILSERRDSILWVTINRPERRNALDLQSRSELDALWAMVADDRTLRAVVLTGVGEAAFCAGADLKEAGPSGLDYWSTDRPGAFGGFGLAREFNVPVLAMVNGHAVGGGFEMVLASDIVVAADHARFGLPEPRRGLMPLDGGVMQLARSLPHQQAMGMLLTGRMISAHEAQQLGVVNEVVPFADLRKATEGWLASILECGPLAIRAIKEMVRHGMVLSYDHARRLMTPALLESLESDEAREGIAAFVERRAPRWAPSTPVRE